MARLKRRPPKVVFRDGKWVVEYYNRDGKRRRPEFATEEEGYQHAALITEQRVSDARRGGPPLDIKAAIKRYVQTKTAKKAYASNEKRNFLKLVNFLCGECSLVYLDEITPLHMEDYQTQRSGEVSASTVNREFTSYRSFFSWCVRMGLREKSPTQPLEMLTVDPKRRKTWSKEEFELIMGRISPEAGNVLTFMAQTGARPIEAVRLTWGDVDFDSRTVTLRSRKGKGVIRERYVPLSQVLAARLLEIHDKLRREFKTMPEHPVFRNEGGKAFDRHSISQAVSRASKELGLSGLTPYGLRHTIGTELAKLDLEAARMLLGHSKLTTTQGYLHYSTDDLRTVMERRSEITGL